MKNKLQHYLTDANINILLIALLLISTLIFSINNFYDYYSFDEAFTILLIDNNFTDIVKITANDVHPPLYYLMLKIYTLIFGKSVFIFKSFSLLGVIFTMLLSLWPIKKLFGKVAAIIYVCVFLLLPSTQYITGEIRMYSWCNFFVTCTGILAYICFIKDKLRYWILYYIFVLLSAYTHNYGLLTVALITFTLIILIFYNKRHALKHCLYLLLPCILLYLPWFFVLLNQARSEINNDNLWMKTPSLYEAIKYSYYIFDAGAKGLLFEILGFSLLIISVILIFNSFRNIVKIDNKIHPKFIFSILCLFVFTCVSFFGTLITLLITPIFVARYMVVGLGLFALGFSILLAHLDISQRNTKTLMIGFIVLLASHTLYRIYRIHKDHNIKIYNKECVDKFIKNHVNDSTVFVYNIAAYTNEDLYKFRIRYPDREHILYSLNKFTDKTDVYNTFDSLSVKYNSLIVSGELWGNNIVANTSVLNDVEKNYLIKDSIISYENTVLYFLIRKSNSIEKP